MEVQFTPEQLSRLSQIAAHEGIDAERLVNRAALHVLEDNVEFRDAVQKGIEQADRGELIEEEEMDARVTRITGT